MTTQAEKFAARFNNDGQCFETAGGIQFDDVLASMKATATHYTNRGTEDGKYIEQNKSDHVDGDLIIYSFADESAILLAGSAWDIYENNGWGIQLPLESN